MGTYAGYYGDMDIPEEKRDEFTQRVLTLLTQGGMMGNEEVTLFGAPQSILALLPEYMQESEETAERLRDLCARFSDALTTPISPLDTPAFLWTPDDSLCYLKENYGVWNYHITDDDRLLFWREGGDVKLSPRTYWRLRDLAWEHSEIMGEMEEDPQKAIAPEAFLRVFWDALQRAERVYLRLFPQKEMFYDFIAHCREPAVQAAVILLQRLTQRYEKDVQAIYADGVNWTTASLNKTFNPARMALKRYLAVLGNPALRQEFLDF